MRAKSVSVWGEIKKKWFEWVKNEDRCGRAVCGGRGEHIF